MSSPPTGLTKSQQAILDQRIDVNSMYTELKYICEKQVLVVRDLRLAYQSSTGFLPQEGKTGKNGQKVMTNYCENTGNLRSERKKSKRI